MDVEPTWEPKLVWPAGWPRTPALARRPSKFATTFRKAQTGLIDELRRMGARAVVVTANLKPNRVMGGYSADQKTAVPDPGVAVYFSLAGEDRAIPCDRWLDAGDNLHAVAKTIEALRGIERWGAHEMVEAAFRGFAALPAGSMAGSAVDGGDPWVVLGTSRFAGPDDIEAAYRRRVRELHPDAGGDPEAFLRLQAAYEDAKRRSA